MTYLDECERKRIYQNHASAGYAIGRLKKRGAYVKTFERHLVPYKCRYCGYWHIGHEATDSLTRRVNRLARLSDIAAEGG